VAVKKVKVMTSKLLRLHISETARDRQSVRTDDGITAVCNGVRLYDGHRGNSEDGDSIHGNTAVVVTELTVIR